MKIKYLFSFSLNIGIMSFYVRPGLGPKTANGENIRPLITAQ